MGNSKEWLYEKMERISKFKQYPFSETRKEVGLRTGLNPEKIIKLDQNENLFLSKAFLKSLILELSDTIDTRIYSREDEGILRESIGKYVKMPQDFIIVGPGGDQLIDLFVKTFLTQNEGVLSVKPTYSMYGWSADHQGTSFLQVPLKNDFSLNVEEILKESKKGKRMCFLCSPNNPTGNQFQIDDIQRIIEDFEGLVIVDEAYVEYAKTSISNLVRKYDNLVIMRTFSKAFGLASTRIGYAISNPELATIMTKYAQIPFPLNIFGSKMALKLLEKIDVIIESVNKLKKERDILFKKLQNINQLVPFQSDANFILFSTSRPCEQVYAHLLSKGVLLRRIGKVLDFDNCLRTTVGLPEMNKELIEILNFM